jgi:outer membrane scaffolding protein for murein synthesis (MipA/OmpV family)
VIDRRLYLSAAALLLAGATPALAQETPATSERDQIAADFDKDTVTVGIGGAYFPDYEGSKTYRFTPAPVAIGSVKGFAFSVVGNRASLDVIPNRPGQTVDLQLGPVGVVNFDRSSLSSIDDPRIRALGKRGTAIELGGYVGIGKTGVITSPYDKVSVSVSYRKGVSGGHRSDIWEPQFTYLTPLSTKAAVGLYASAEHVGQGYADSYFSITPTQALASGLPTYNAHSGWKSYSVGGFVTYSLTGNLLHGFKVLAGGSYSRELGDFSYSPVTRIAGSPSQWLGALGLAYTF